MILPQWISLLAQLSNSIDYMGGAEIGLNACVISTRAKGTGVRWGQGGQVSRWGLLLLLLLMNDSGQVSETIQELREGSNWFVLSLLG